MNQDTLDDMAFEQDAAKNKTHCGLHPHIDEVTALECRLKRLRAALEPFAKIADDYARADAVSEQHHKDEGRSWKPHSDSHRTSIGLGDCRRARAALDAMPLQDGSKK